MPSVNTVLAVSLSLVVLSTQSYALSNYGEAAAQPHFGARRSHLKAPHVPNRMIKMKMKRQDEDPIPTGTRRGGGVGGPSTTTTVAPVRTTSTTAAVSPRTTTTAAGSSTTTAAGVKATTETTASALTTNTQPTVATTATTAVSSAAAETTQAAPTTATDTLNLSGLSDRATGTTARGASTVAFTKSFEASSTAEAEEKNDTGSNFGKNSMIAIAVIASCIAGALGIWTLIRKWKLSPSRKFEDRMQPIEWSPDGLGSSAAAKDAEGGMTEKHRRGGSAGSHGSFHSADHTIGRNVTGNTNMFADQQPTALALPPHDFTAGPSDVPYDYKPQPAPYEYSVGANDGYADLQRGNSGRTVDNAGAAYDYPPTHAAYDANAAYGTGADLNRGPSLNRSDYSHQDPYGGYDAYPAQTQQGGVQYTSSDPYATYGAYGQGYQNTQQRGY